MNYGFVKVAAVTPEVKVADCRFNAEEIIKNIKKILIIFPKFYSNNSSNILSALK